MSDQFENDRSVERLRSTFDPRRACTREFPGEWAPVKNIPPTLLLPSDGTERAMLSGGATGYSVTNYSEQDVFVFNRSGELVDTIPATYESMAPRRGPWEESYSQRSSVSETLPPDPLNHLHVRHTGNPLKRKPTHAELVHVVRDGEEAVFDRRYDPIGTGIGGTTTMGRDVLKIMAYKLCPVGYGMKDGRIIPASNMLSADSRSQDALCWHAKVSVRDLEGNSYLHDGCDSIYHPGLGLYFSTNRYSEYVGKIDSSLFTWLISNDAPLRSDNLYPVTVFVSPNDTVEELYFSFDNRNVFKTPAVKSPLLPRGEIGIRIVTCPHPGEYKVESLNISLSNLRLAGNRIVIADIGMVIGEDHQNVCDHIACSDDQKNTETVLPNKNGYITIAEHNRELESLRDTCQALRRQNTTTNTHIAEVVEEMKSDNPLPYGDVIKKLQLMTTSPRTTPYQYVKPTEKRDVPPKPPPNPFSHAGGHQGPSMGPAMDRVSATTQNVSIFASLTKNIKEILVAGAAIVSVVAGVAAWAFGLFSKAKAAT